MPIYEYRCTRCGHQLEQMQKLSDPPPETCPQCNERQTLERVLSRTSFQLKGGGWGADLYGSAKPVSTTAPKTDAPAAPSTTPAAPTTAPATAPAVAPSSSGSSPSSSGSSTGGSTK